MFTIVTTVTLLVMAVPAVVMVQGLLAGNTDPKFVGAAVLDLAVIAGLLLLLPFGGRRPGLALVAFGSMGVMVYATAWLFAGPAEALLNVASLVMCVVALWAAITKVDRMRDETHSHFAR
ncbi:hypothetical protein [Micropruina sp.]|uniref:hypothetical protein n=1 Tax=Micropruina sp. TaxID=2737536 RepID=UPI0039E72469